MASDLINITKNEDQGIKDIINFYGGNCKYSKGFLTLSDNRKVRYFELELSKADEIDLFITNTEVPASNVAYRFFSKLKEERDNYDEIRAVLLFNNGTKTQHTYSKDQLENMEAKLGVAIKAVELIKRKDYTLLKDLLSDVSFTQKSIDELIKGLQTVEPTLGAIQEFRLLGFRVFEKNGSNILHISGVLIRDKVNNQFSIDIDNKVSENKILSLDYRF